MSEAPPLILFDVDGTLVDAGGVGGRAMTRVGQRMFGPAFTFQGVHFGGRLDNALLHEAARRAGVQDIESHAASFQAAYLDELNASFEVDGLSVQALPGVLALIDELVEQQARGGLTLGLLTGNYAEGARLKLRAAGIDPTPFRIGAFGEDAHTRPELTEIALRRHLDLRGQAVSSHRVLIVGDTPADVACAQAHGCRSFCVTTGRYSLEELEEAGADWVVADLADPSPLLAVLTGISSGAS